MPRLLLIALASLLLAVPAAHATHAGPLAGQWHLDEVVGEGTPDSSGHGLRGDTLRAILEPGRWGNAMRWNGANGQVLVPRAAVLEPQRVSLLAWVRRDGSPGQRRYLVAKGGQGCAGSSYALYSGANGGVQFYVGDGGAGLRESPVASPEAIWDDRWHAVAGTFDGTRTRLYVDGIEVGQPAAAPTTIGYPLQEGALTIRQYPRQGFCGNDDFRYDGQVDEVRVYDRALSAAEIARLHDRQAAEPPTLVPDEPPPSPSPSPSPSPVPPARVPSPPTAPTPAPPPRITGLTIAAPLVSGQAALLNATVAGAAQYLAWDVNGDDRTDALCPGGQTTLRLRATSAFRGEVSVRAVRDGVSGPGFAQRFAVGPAAGGGLSPALRRVVALVAQRPPVLACAGAKDVGTGTSELAARPTSTIDLDGWRRRLAGLSCVERTIVSGTLRMTGCFSPIRSADQLPDAERASIKPVLALGKFSFTATQKGAEPGPARFVDRALDFTDAYVSYAPVSVNGVRLAPQGKGAIVVFPQVRRLVSSNAEVTVGGMKLDHPPAFSLNTVAANAAGRIPLGAFRRTSGTSSLGGFPLVGDVGIVLTPPTGTTPAGAEVTTQLELPDFLSLAGVRIPSRIRVALTPEGQLVLDDLRIGPVDAELGPIGLEGLQLEYERATGEWRGMGKLCVSVTPACLDARTVPGQAPPGGVVIKDGELQRLYANVGFPAPGITLFPGLQLNRIGAGLGLNPTRLLGSAKATAVGIFEIDGNLVLAFPSQAAPFRLTREEAGNAFPAEYYARPYPRFTMALGADGFLKVPILDARIRLGGAYLLYHFPGYVAFGGGMDYDFLGVVSLKGRTDGEFNAGNGRFNLRGDVEACVLDIVCRGSVAAVSSVGVGACVTLDVVFGDINIGGGVRYDPFKVILWPFDGCRWSRFVDPNVFSRRGGSAITAQAPGTHTVRIERGDRSRAIQFDGSDGAPRVRVTTPDGKVVASPPGGPGAEITSAVRILRSERMKATVVGLVDPVPGTYAIQTLPGSPPVRKVTEAQDPPAARVSARVEGEGARRTLVYDVARRPDQRVTFVETGPDGNRPLGTVTGGRGRLSFSPAPGRGSRRIEAQFELAGIRAETRTVARFTPPSPRLGRPARISTRRRGRALRVDWPQVAGATRYDVVVSTTAGAVRRASARRPGATLRGVPRSAGGRVTVRAVATLRRGAPRSVPFRAAARRPRTRFAPLASRGGRP